MTRIGSADQILLLLREQLQRSGRTDRKRDAMKADGVEGRPLDRLRALAAFETLDPHELRRTVVRGLLTEEFGEAAANDAAFQVMADDVLRMIGEAPGGPELIDRAIAQLKEGKA